MAGSKTGTLYSIMTFGESHGPFIGVVIDGIKPGIEIDETALQQEMTRRRPGQSSVTTPRQEKDRARIVSGVFEGKTTGTPLCIIVENEDQRSKDYGQIKDIYRPGHASFTFLKKYGMFDYRGGGRASGRETAMRVAAGAIAKQVLAGHGIAIHGFTRQIGSFIARTVDYNTIETNAVRCPDPEIAPQRVGFIESIAEAGDSVGGIVELHITGLPAGLGDPVFDKIDAELAKGIMSIGAVKGVEFGDGFAVANQLGSQTNDVFFQNESGEILPRTNHAGGILGGISTGQPLVLRLAVKPPSSIRKEQITVDKSGKEINLSIGGRHDPCICPRVVPVAEAMAALVLLDLLLIQEAILENRADVELDQPAQAIVDAQILLLLKEKENPARKGTGASGEQIEEWCRQLGLDAERVKGLLGG